MMMEIGLAVPRVDARAKVTGEERYAIDHYPPHLLWAGPSGPASPMPGCSAATPVPPGPCPASSRC